jgi:catechol 2,3-dioxygenase-like lactoylglutathione lyase family enzyme
MTTVAAARMHHIALTVRDLEASTSWYSDVFSLGHLMDVPHEGGVGRILASQDMGLVFALHAHDSSAGEPFAETRTGLDHIGIVVPLRTDLEQWQDHLASHGVVRADRADKPLRQSPIADEPYGSVLVFRDPDNIQLEMFAPPAAT